MAPKRTTRSTADQETVNATTVTNAQLQAMIDQGVTAALAARDALRSTNGDDSHNSGTGVRRTERAARECTYTDFLKCQPLPFKGTEGTVGHEAAYGMSWKTLMKMMTDKYCPRNEIRKLEMELWELKVNEADKIEKYVGGLPDMIHESVVASKPKTMQEAIEISTELMDKKIRTFAERETTSKREFENTSRNTRNQQQQQHSNKRQNTGRVYTAASGEKKQYGGSRPLCAKCNYHHDGPCAPKCHNCNKVGHYASDCRSVANTNNANNQRDTGSGQKLGCYECGVQGHFKRECPKLKNNNNHGNQGGRNNAPARVYIVGHARTDPDANVVTGTFLLNNRYASILFDTGADRSFVSTTFSTQINITPHGNQGGRNNAPARKDCKKNTTAVTPGQADKKPGASGRVFAITEGHAANTSDFMPGLEEPEQAPLSPEYVPEPIYPEYLAPSDDDITIEYQPLPADASPTALSLGYIADSDPKKDP
nr:hypothetical protein [Tanacetum cinerariifolium]